MAFGGNGNRTFFVFGGKGLWRKRSILYFGRNGKLLSEYVKKKKNNVCIRLIAAGWHIYFFRSC
jgi:hypothetical protein